MPGIELRRAFWPAILFRWLLWTLSIGLLVAGFPARLSLPTALALGSLTAIYLLLWTLRVADITHLASSQPAILLLDLVLSIVPTWLSHGQAGPLAPFALGALVLPGMIYHWRGVLGGTVVYMALGVLGSWITSRVGLMGKDAEWFSLLSRPLIAASVLPISDVLWRRRRISAVPASRLAPSPARSTILPRASLMRSMEAAALARRDTPPATATAIQPARPHLQTLEWPRVTDVYGAIRQAVAEAEDHGLRIQLLAQGSAPALPPNHVQLLARAVEITLDNVRCHAHTLEAEVCVTSTEDGVALTIRDRGVGLLDGTAEPPGFHQLRRLRYRLEEIEGSLTVHEEAGGGVIVTARVPSVGPDIRL